MKKPLVSVVIATYNRRKYLRYALESILSQTYTNLEVIVVDDGSTDGSENLVKSYNDKRIKYIYQENGGQNNAKNTGLCSAKGKYLSILDSDDIWHSQKVEKQVKVLEAKPDVGLVYCGTNIIDEDNNLIDTQPMVFYRGNVVDKLMMKNFLYNGSNAMYRAECIYKTGVFDNSVKRMTDWDLYLRISLSYNFDYVNEYLLYYRVHNDNMSCGFEKYEEAGLKILERLFDNPLLSKNHKKLRNKAYAARYSYMARRYFENAQMSIARKNIQKAFCFSPSVFFKTRLPVLLVSSFLPDELVGKLRSINRMLKSKQPLLNNNK